ncbi:helix-turn-helix domain-containing protein [Candidatus Clostridium radicumherbarum]|uniref:Helix-turn-helix domain-containing protein n=1 Tax=Candidatus Clostridium radicumherbarum TaxID=3381662 RepID=A0ABW8TU88_9CLOT
MDNTIGNKIKILRKSKKLTQKQLAEIAGISEISIKKYERNIITPKYSTLEKIANALNVSIIEFLELEAQIEAEFEERYNISEKTDTDLEIQTMLSTTDKKLAISSMLTNFSSIKSLMPIDILDEDLDLLSEAIVSNIISTITIFKNINSGLLRETSKLHQENTELKKVNINLNDQIFSLKNDVKLNTIYEPFTSLEEQKNFEESLKDDIEKGYFDKKNN